jgi:hypothetical protein
VACILASLDKKFEMLQACENFQDTVVLLCSAAFIIFSSNRGPNGLAKVPSHVVFRG